jgi:hypothetical protein
MLAGQLAEIIDNILEEYRKFKIIELLREATALLSQRDRLNDPQYSQQADAIRQRAKQIEEEAISQRYLATAYYKISRSARATVLPESIGRMLLNTLPLSRTGTPTSSGEIQFYLNEATGFQSELAAAKRAMDSFGVERISIPEDRISLDTLIPRRIFNEQPDKYYEYMGILVEIISYFTEFIAGSKEYPTLVYSSTTDQLQDLRCTLLSRGEF